MARVPPPSRKGEPPLPDETAGNLDKQEPGTLSHLNFRVPKAFHKEFGIFALQHDMNQTELLYESFRLVKAKYEGQG
jgi:hypothetical protein